MSSSWTLEPPVPDSPSLARRLPLTLSLGATFFLCSAEHSTPPRKFLNISTDPINPLTPG